jgi:ferritin
MRFHKHVVNLKTVLHKKPIRMLYFSSQILINSYHVPKSIHVTRLPAVMMCTGLGSASPIPEFFIGTQIYFEGIPPILAKLVQERNYQIPRIIIKKMTRIAFFLCVATLFSQGAHSFSLVKESSSTKRSTALAYANSETLELPKLNSFRDSIARSYERLEEPAFSPSKLLTNQLAREFSTARRYLLATGAVKGLTQHFYAAEEQQRFRAMELIEYARINDIVLDDYNSQINTTPIDKTLAPQDFVQELLLQEQQDIKFLEKALAQATASMNSPDLVDFLDSIRSSHVLRLEETVQVLTHFMPSLDIPHSLSVVELTTAQTADIASRLNLNRLPESEDFGVASRLNMNHLPKSEDFGVVGNNQQIHATIPHVTAAGAIGVAAVDTDSLPSTDDILDALPSTEEFLDALPINAEDLVQVVDNTASNFATFIGEQSELVDTLQQNLLDTETLSQLVDIVTQLY